MDSMTSGLNMIFSVSRVLLWSLIMSACVSSSNSSVTLEQIYDNLDVSGEKELLLVNLDLCSSCMSNTIQMINDSLDSKSFYVLVSTKSNKKYNIFKDQISMNQFVFRDTTDLILNSRLELLVFHSLHKSSKGDYRPDNKFVYILTSIYEKIPGLSIDSRFPLKPEFFISEDVLIFFSQFTSEIFIVNRDSEVVFHKAYYNSRSGPMIVDGIRKVIVHEDSVFLIFANKIVKLNISDFEESEIKLNLPTPILPASQVLFLDDKSLLITLFQIKKERSLAFFYSVDLTTGLGRLIKEIDFGNLPAPYFLTRKIGDFLYQLSMDTNYLLKLNSELQIYDTLKFELPKEYNVRYNEVLYSNEIGIASDRLLSDYFSNFTLDSDKLYLSYHLMSDSIGNRFDSEDRLLVYDFKEKSSDLLRIDNYHGFQIYGSGYFFLKDSIDNAFLFYKKF
jgi:hypothetical protein